MGDVTCPYCEHEQDEPDDSYEPDERYEVECRGCEKTFQVVCEYHRTWDSYKTPCLNEGGEHKWKKRKGYPEEYFVNKYACEYCDERKDFEKPPEAP